MREREREREDNYYDDKKTNSYYRFQFFFSSDEMKVISQEVFS